MHRLSLFVLLIAAICCNAAPTDEDTPHPKDVPGFKYLGSLRKFDGKELNEHDYYSSASSGDWSRAEADCKTVFGEGGHIMSIQSLEEQEFINKWLQDRGSGGALFWTSGQYDMPTTSWKWAGAGDEVVYTNWGEEEPAQPVLGFSRIALEHQNQFSAWWRNIQNTELFRYVCEMPAPTPTDDPSETTTTDLTTPDPTKPVVCDVINDLAIVLDASGSIGLDNYDHLKEFAAILAEAFVAKDGSRIAFITYAETVETVVDLTDVLTSSELRDKILSATYQTGPTPTDQAIHEATRTLTQNGKDLRTYLVITDGISNEPVKTKEEADAAVTAGIRTFALGITINVSEEELTNIAGGSSANVFMSSEFADVDQLLAAISKSLCPSD